MRLAWLGLLSAHFGTAMTLAACDAGDHSDANPEAGLGSPDSGLFFNASPSPDGGPIGGDRPVEIHVPSSYAPGIRVPLVIMLHGYSTPADTEERYLDITPQADARGFIYALPSGTLDTSGNVFWNCCDFGGATVDDSTYLSGVISAIEAHYSIDQKRVFLIGHSNGGFMAYRMARDHADQIAAIVSLSGAMPLAPPCTPILPVSVLEIHGTADMTVAFDGGSFNAEASSAYPSVSTTIGDWVTFDQCSKTPDTSAPPLDLDADLLGSETLVTKYVAGCEPGGDAELWTVVGGTHIPALSAAFAPDVVEFLYKHPKP